MSTIDLNSPPEKHNYKVELKPEETSGDAMVRHFRDVIMILITVGLVGLVGYICAETLFSETTSPEAKRWAQSALVGAMGGMVGYMAKK